MSSQDDNTETIVLVADRNPRVRDLIRRELSGEACRVIMSDRSGTLLAHAFGQPPARILIIDPDLPEMDPMELLEKIRNRIPPLRLIIHALPVNDYEQMLSPPDIRIEKTAQSVEQIRRTVRRLLTEAPS